MSKSESKSVEEGIDGLPSKLDTHNGQSETTPSQGIANVVNNEEHEEVGRKKKRPLAFHLTFLALLLNVFLYALDATTLGVALPSIVGELGGSTLQSFWASIAYLLAVVVTQPLYATVSDVLGRKIPLYFASILFLVGSLVFALARNMTHVIAGRVLQGLGGSGLDILSEIIVTDMTTLKERPLYLGLMALPTAVGTVLGPSVGGLFSAFVTWRWIGWLNLPILSVAVTLTVFFLRLRSLEPSSASKLGRLDWIGMVLFASGTTLFALPVSWAGALFSWSSWPTILLLVLGVVLLVGFAVYEQFPETPLMPHRLFYSRTAVMTLVGSFFHGMSLFSLLQWLPLLYQAALFETVLFSAVILLPTSVATVIFAIAGVTAVGAVGKGYRWAISLSWALTTVGTGLLLLLDIDSSAALRGGAPVLWGAGIGLLLRLLFLPSQASVPRVDDTSLAISALMTLRIFGGLLGIAACSTIFSSLFTLDSIPGMDKLDPITLPKDADEAVRFIPSLRNLHLPEEVSIAIRKAYLTPMRAIFYAMTAVGGLGFLSSLFMEDLDLEKTEMSQQQFET